MAAAFYTAFDITAHPEAIQPAWGFYSIFWGALAVLAVLTLSGFRWQWASRTKLLASTIFAGGIILAATISDVRYLNELRENVARGSFETVEGCLAYFGAGGGKNDEQWVIGDHTFSYRQGRVTPEYHLVEGEGGSVHRDSRVQVSFVSTRHDRNAIVKLQVEQGACPPAPHIRYQRFDE